jgi:hypothetical protein
MAGLLLEEVVMEPVKASEVVHERHHHGRIIGDVDPNRFGYAPNQNCLMLPAPSIPVADGMKVYGITKGHTSYQWTEEIPK